ncbi:MAG: LysM peptidoglycan-binding domain-containing protein [Actinobacteria bacterium]|nr:MAG: LysM peptidoglycan-binding domain-containing protein [Actinomycetota bacterium]
MGERAMGYRSPARFLAPVALALSGVIVVIVVGAAGKHRGASSGGSTPAATRLHGHHYYRVRSGDTLLSVALHTHLPLAQLQQLNPGVDPSTLVPGQRLRLVAAQPRAPRRHLAPSAPARPAHWPAWWPPPPVRPHGPQSVVVRSGDTLSAIAQRSHLPLARLKHLNPKIDPNTLRVGQRLRLR